MRVLVGLDPVYWDALSILARGTGRKSRQELVEDILVEVVNGNKGLLDEARQMRQRAEELKIEVKIDAPPLIPDAKVKRYRFISKDGTILEGVGAMPMDALKAATGRAYTFAEYNEEFERHDIVHEEV